MVMCLQKHKRAVVVGVCTGVPSEGSSCGRFLAEYCVHIYVNQSPTQIIERLCLGNWQQGKLHNSENSWMSRRDINKIRDVGFYGERMAEMHFLEHGFNVAWPVVTDGTDFIAYDHGQTWQIQVKTMVGEHKRID